MVHKRGKGLEAETGEGIYEILTDGGFYLLSGYHIEFFWHSGILAFSLFPSRAYLAPGLTVLFSSDTPDYSRLPSAAFIIIFFLLLHRYVIEGMSQFEVFSSVVVAFITQVYIHKHLYACSNRHIWEMREFRFHTLPKWVVFMSRRR